MYSGFSGVIAVNPKKNPAYFAGKEIMAVVKEVTLRLVPPDPVYLGNTPKHRCHASN
jgi:hypothetical protein